MVDEQLSQERAEQFSEIIESGENEKRLALIFKVIGVVIFVGSLLFLIFYKNSHPEFPLGTVIIIGVISFILGLGLFFIFNIKKIATSIINPEVVPEKEKIPPHATPEQIEGKIEEFIKFKRRNIIVGWGEIIPHDWGDSIYAYELELLYSEKNIGHKIYVIVNANFLDSKPLIPISGRYSRSVIKSFMRGLSITKESSPSEVVRITENPFLGTTERLKIRDYGERNKQDKGEGRVS